MRLRFRDERGATAIEYGLIAGLIALGLVGSLVGTRGSLSSVFGGAASSMGSATGPSSGTTARSAIAYWQAKGTPSKSVDPTDSGGLYTVTTWTYPDGSTVARSVSNKGTLNPVVVSNDAVTNLYSAYRPSTTNRPEGLFLYQVDGTFQSWYKIDPYGNFTDHSTGALIKDDVTKRPSFADIFSLYGYYGTNP